MNSSAWEGMRGIYTRNITGGCHKPTAGENVTFKTTASVNVTFSLAVDL
jgi:hypothetical protein